MESNSAVPRGSLVSKPTWANTAECSPMSAFFVLGRVRMGPCCFEVFAAAGHIRCKIRSGKKGVAMNGKEVLERGLRHGIPLWRIEDELDWRENQSRWTEDDAREQRAPVVRRAPHDMASTWQSAVRGTKAMGRLLRHSVSFLFGLF